MSLDLTGRPFAEYDRIAADNRERFPEWTKIVDEFRAVFGDVRVKWVKEGDKTVGRVPEGGGA